MTKEDLINYGYIPRESSKETFCHEPFLCALRKDGWADVRTIDNPNKCLGEAYSLKDIRNIEKAWWRQRLKNHVGDIMAISMILSGLGEEVPESVHNVIKDYFGDVK